MGGNVPDGIGPDPPSEDHPVELVDPVLVHEQTIRRAASDRRDGVRCGKRQYRSERPIASFLSTGRREEPAKTAYQLATLALGDYVIDRWKRSERQLAQANDVISRYVASQLAQRILTGQHDSNERHARRRVTLFFSDIKGFAEIADLIEPEDLSEMLNEYLSEMAAIADRYGGTIDKFIGDAVMILFGAPAPIAEHEQAVRAVQMAIDMQVRLDALRSTWLQNGFAHPFQIRVGINTGQASIGSFGSKGRMDYTAIGRQVNLAARLQAHCDPGKILISHSTWLLLKGAITCTPKGSIHIKGFHAPIEVYEVVGRMIQGQGNALPGASMPE